MFCSTTRPKAPHIYLAHRLLSGLLERARRKWTSRSTRAIGGSRTCGWTAAGRTSGLEQTPAPAPHRGAQCFCACATSGSASDSGVLSQDSNKFPSVRGLALSLSRGLGEPVCSVPCKCLQLPRREDLRVIAGLLRSKGRKSCQDAALEHLGFFSKTCITSCPWLHVSSVCCACYGGN